jgi:hypothetical protein
MLTTTNLLEAVFVPLKAILAGLTTNLNDLTANIVVRKKKIPKLLLQNIIFCDKDPYFFLFQRLLLQRSFLFPTRHPREREREKT